MEGFVYVLAYSSTARTSSLCIFYSRLLTSLRCAQSSLFPFLERTKLMFDFPFSSFIAWFVFPMERRRENESKSPRRVNSCLRLAICFSVTLAELSILVGGLGFLILLRSHRLRTSARSHSLAGLRRGWSVEMVRSK